MSCPRHRSTPQQVPSRVQLLISAGDGPKIVDTNLLATDVQDHISFKICNVIFKIRAVELYQLYKLEAQSRVLDAHKARSANILNSLKNDSCYDLTGVKILEIVSLES